jgi:hypothetical protein
MPDMAYRAPCSRRDHAIGAVERYAMPWSGRLLVAHSAVSVRVEHRDALATLPAGTLVEDVARSWDPVLDWAVDQLFVRSGDLAGECVATEDWPLDDGALPAGFDDASSEAA